MIPQRINNSKFTKVHTFAGADLLMLLYIRVDFELKQSLKVALDKSVYEMHESGVKECTEINDVSGAVFSSVHQQTLHPAVQLPLLQ